MIVSVFLLPTLKLKSISEWNFFFFLCMCYFFSGFRKFSVWRTKVCKCVLNEQMHLHLAERLKIVVQTDRAEMKGFMALCHSFSHGKTSNSIIKCNICWRHEGHRLGWIGSPGAFLVWASHIFAVWQSLYSWRFTSGGHLDVLHYRRLSSALRQTLLLQLQRIPPCNWALACLPQRKRTALASNVSQCIIAQSQCCSISGDSRGKRISFLRSCGLYSFRLGLCFSRSLAMMSDSWAHCVLAR